MTSDSSTPGSAIPVPRSRVLIVDDEQSIRTSLGKFAESAGHEVSLAGDAAEALSLLNKEPFDVVVTDIILPRKTGVTLLGEIRELQPDVQVIMITGEPEVGTAAEAVRKGAFDYLSKPVSREDITRALTLAAAKKVLLDRSRQLEEENRKHREHLEEMVHERTEELGNSATRYMTLFNNIPDPVLVFAEEEGSLLLDCNQNALDRYGYTMEELRTMSPKDLHPSEEQDLVDSNISIDEVSLNQYTHVTKAGEHFPVEVHSSSIDYQGRSAWISIARDITERREIEEALRQSEETYRTLLSNLNAGVVVHASDTSIQIANHAACDLLGLSEDQLFGREASDPYWRFLREDGSEMSLDEYPVNQVLSTGEPLTEQIVGVRRSQATKDISWLLVNGFSVLSDSGEREQVVITFVDITARKLVEASLEEAFSGVVLALSRVSQERDPYTTGHQQRVAELAVAIAQELGLPGETQEGIRIAGLIYDIGKISIPMEILVKPTAPSAIEWQMIRSHSSSGASLLEGIQFPWPIQEIVLQHHEKLDGSGYPRGLTGDQILAEAQIIAVADVVEAMSSHRPYRAALGVDAALEALRQDRGVQLDSDTVDACLRIFETGKFAFPDTQTNL